MKPQFEVLHLPPKNTNSVLLTVGRDCVIFDPWGNPADWLELLEKRELNLRGIYLTHGHPDHVCAAPQLSNALDVPWYMNHGDLFMMVGCNAFLDYFGMPKLPNSYDAPIDLPAGSIEILPGVWGEVILSPGHSAGGVAFSFPDSKVLIIGDSIFQQGLGRWDLPSGDVMILKQSVSNIYNMNFPDDTTVIHGHGENTTIGGLKKENKYFKPLD